MRKLLLLLCVFNLTLLFSQKDIRLIKTTKGVINKDSLFILENKNCKYITNEKDEFTGKGVIKTTWYTLKSEKELILVMFRKINKSKTLVFSLNKYLGCTVSFKGQASTVKIKLENNTIVSFYNIADTNCGDFMIIGNLTEKDILKLKSSPIKTIRFHGDRYYHDVKKILYPNFFIDKLNCIK